MKTKQSKWGSLTEFMIIHDNIGYNAELKEKFTKLGRAGLKELAVELEKTNQVKCCTMSYNKAGIACSGDFHLKGDILVDSSKTCAFDFFFNLDCGNRFFTYRRTLHKEDYTGLVNHQVPFTATIEDVVRRILLLGNSQHN